MSNVICFYCKRILKHNNYGGLRGHLAWCWVNWQHLWALRDWLNTYNKKELHERRNDRDV